MSEDTRDTRDDLFPLRKPVLVIDGDCGFCRFWAIRWQRAGKDGFDLATYQEVADRFPAIPEDEFARAVQLIEVGGRVTAGAEAVFRSLATAPRRGFLLWLYTHIALFRWSSDRTYRFVADHRPFFSKLTFTLFGRGTDSPR